MGANFTGKETSVTATQSREAPRLARFTPAAPEEGARLIRAFVKIPDPAVRQTIIDWVCEQAKCG